LFFDLASFNSYIGLCKFNIAGQTRKQIYARFLFCKIFSVACKLMCFEFGGVLNSLIVFVFCYKV